MNRAQLKASYLRKAKEAEEKAAKAADAQTKEGWLEIANGYRRIAGEPDPPLRWIDDRGPEPPRAKVISDRGVFMATNCLPLMEAALPIGRICLSFLQTRNHYLGPLFPLSSPYKRQPYGPRAEIHVGPFFG